MNILKGKLTYTVAVITGLWAVVGYFLGNLDPMTAGNMLLGALAVFGLRRAI